MRDWKREAYLLALEGREPIEIAGVLNTSVTAVLDWLAEAEVEARGLATSLPPDTRSQAERDSDRVRVAQAALAYGKFLDVAWGEALMGDADLGVGFWDPLAGELSDLVDETVVLLRRMPGVSRAVREDTEFIAIYCAAVNPVELEAALMNWWQDQLYAIISRTTGLN